MHHLRIKICKKQVRIIILDGAKRNVNIAGFNERNVKKEKEKYQTQAFTNKGLNPECKLQFQGCNLK